MPPPGHFLAEENPGIGPEEKQRVGFAGGAELNQQATPPGSGSDLPNREVRSILFLDFLKNRPFSFFPVGLTVLRSPHAPAAPPPGLIPPPPRFWVSAGVSGGVFDPVLHLQNNVVATVTNSAAYLNNAGSQTTDQTALRSTPGGALRLSVRAGLNLSRRYWVEGGLEAFRGKSSLQNGLLLIDRSTSTASSFYDKLLNPNAANLGLLGTQNVAVPADYRVGTTFRYAAVPLRLGYRLWPDRRLEGAVFAGVSGEVFLSNVLESFGSTTHSVANYTPADRVYKNLTLSGLAGLRLRYRLTRRWGLVLETSHRQALTPGLRSDLGVRMSPRETGAGLWVMRYF